jgi:hypothetical protein
MKPEVNAMDVVVAQPSQKGNKCAEGHCSVISNRDKSNLRGLMAKNKMVTINKKVTMNSLAPDSDFSDMD